MDEKTSEEVGSLAGTVLALIRGHGQALRPDDDVIVRSKLDREGLRAAVRVCSLEQLESAMGSLLAQTDDKKKGDE